MEYSATQKRKWKKEIRNEFLARPLLLKKLKVPQGLATKIFDDILPEPDEIDLLDSRLKDDRIRMSNELRPLLHEVIKARECVQVAEKLDMNETTLRTFLKGQLTMLTYNSILKIEYYLNHITSRKISPENTELAKHFIREKLDNLQETMNKIGADIQFNSYYFNSIEKIAHKNSLTENEKFRIEQAKSQIVNSISRLNEVMRKFDALCKAYR